MLGLISLRQRRVQAELLDDPALPPDQQARALAGLARLNAYSLTTGPLWRSIAALARRTGARRLTLLDVATGAGDVPLRLGRRARRHGLELELHACDVNPHSLQFAAARSRRAGIPLVLQQLDVLHASPPGTYDVVTSSLFLHHLSAAQGVQVLARLKAATRALLLISDLRRSRLGLLAAWLATRALLTSEVVRVDALRSFRAAWSAAELRELAVRSGLASARISRARAFRYLLEWRP